MHTPTVATHVLFFPRRTKYISGQAPVNSGDGESL